MSLLISALLSLKAFRLSWPLAYKLLSVLLFVALATEILAILCDEYLYQFKGWNYFTSNYWIMTFSIAPQYLLYMAVYYEVLHNKRIKKRIIWVAIIFTFFVILNVSFWQGINAINSLSHLFADIIMLILVYVYFEQLRTQKKIVVLARQPMVWISIGVFIYHLLNVPFLYCLEFLFNSYPMLSNSVLQVYHILIFLSYTFFIKAFLCPQPQK